MTEISSIRGHPIPPQWQLDTPHGIHVACRRVLGPEGRKSVAPAARGCCPNGGVANFPSSPRRGRCAINKKPRSILSSRRRGGDQSPEQFCWNLVTTPSAPERRLRDIFVDVASTPPRRGGENCGPLRFGNSPARPGTLDNECDRGPSGRKIYSHNLTPLWGWACN
jgi:hypothetical protein